jgi:hypothetical protein
VSQTNRRVDTPPAGGILATDVDSRTKRVRVLAKLLDNSISIPGTGWKIGFDPIVGLIPGIGDLIGAILSGYIILEAARAEISTLTLARMLGNVGLDTILGAVPALGDFFDAAWKANTKNVALLERHLAGRASGAVAKRAGVAKVVVAAIVLILILGAGLGIGIYVAQLLWNRGTR